MVDLHLRPRSSFVLSLVLALRYPGYAVLDGFGIAPSGFRGIDLYRAPPAARAGLLERVLERLLERYRPRHVVLGLPPAWARGRNALRRAAEAALDRARVPFSLEPSTQACVLFLGRSRQRRRDELATALCHHFRLADAQPRRGRGRVDLAKCIAHHGERERCHRSAWKALALALGKLVELQPFAAGALLRERVTPLPAFHARLTHAARTHALAV